MLIPRDTPNSLPSSAWVSPCSSIRFRHSSATNTGFLYSFFGVSEGVILRVGSGR